MKKDGKKSGKKAGQWLQQHAGDPYVKRSIKEGYRSRAVYKLIQIHDKDRLFKPGQVVVDLGAAPGGWSQVAQKFTQPNGKVIALDLLAMEPIDGVDFIQGDFTEDNVYDQLMQVIDNREVDLVISDMAPNISGVAVRDQARMAYLAECALDFAQQVLKQDGDFLIKWFQGADLVRFRTLMQQNFDKVLIRKPDASRSKSKEVYLLGKSFNRRV